MLHSVHIKSRCYCAYEFCVDTGFKQAQLYHKQTRQKKCFQFRKTNLLQLHMRSTCMPAKRHIICAAQVEKDMPMRCTLFLMICATHLVYFVLAWAVIIINDGQRFLIYVRPNAHNQRLNVRKRDKYSLKFGRCPCYPKSIAFRPVQGRKCP